MKDQTNTSYLIQMQVGFNEGGKQTRSDQEIIAIVERETAKTFDGFTETITTGFWKGSKEKAIKIEIVTFDKDNDYLKLKHVASLLCTQLKQESILLSCTSLEKSEFVERVGA